MTTRHSTVIVVVTAVLAVTVLSGVGAVMAQDGVNGPTVSVDNPDTVAPGEEFEVVVSGEDAIELELTDLPAGWMLTDVSTEPGDTLAFSPSPGELPNESAGGDTWLAIFDQEQADASYTLTIKAPDAEGTSEFTAGAEDAVGATAMETFDIEVDADEATVGAEHPDLVEPGDVTEITIDGTNVADLALTDLPEGWTLTDVSVEPSNGTMLDPDTDALPVESGDEEFAEWFVGFETTDSSVSATFTLEAPETEDDYTFTAEGTATEAAGGGVISDTVDIRVRSIPDTVTFEEEVEPNGTTDITVGGADVEELRLSDLPANWTVTDTTASQIQGTIFFPSLSDLPQESEEGDTWLAIFGGPQAVGTFTVTVEAPDIVGEYDFTAEALNGDEVSEEFTINVTEEAAEPEEPVEHESGVSQELFDAVDSNGDGQLVRSDVREMINGYATEGEVDGVALDRSDVRNLINYYATQ